MTSRTSSDALLMDVQQKLFARYYAENTQNAKYFAAAMSGLMGVFIIKHWIAKLYYRFELGRKSSLLNALARFNGRMLRQVNCERGSGFFATHPGETLVVMIYSGINGLLTGYQIPGARGQVLGYLNKRCGWMALLNMCLTVFLALKNTPLAPLAGKTFDELNALHRVAGVFTIAFATAHGIIYIYTFWERGMLWRLNVLTEHAGMVGGVAFILILLTSLSPIRKRFYELFSALHHLLAALVIITAGIHRPDISKKALIIVIVTGAMWALDKGLRHARWLYHWHGNHATIIPLPNGATKVVMRRCLSATPGSKVFLWLPSVGFFERHPFTLVTNEPRAAFVIKSQNGFTRRLHARAHQYPGEKFYASIEGPYGRAPDPKLFDKVLLIAGGSGVTFTMSLALNWSRKRDRANHAQTLDFVWIVKDESCLEWFATELQELRSDPSMHIKLFVTQRSSPALSIDYAHSEFEKTLHEVELGGGGDDDVEKAVSRTASVRSSASLRSFARPGRPDLYQTVAQAIAGLKESHRILIAGCGPPGMVKGVQKVVRQCPAQDSPDFSLFFETFKY